MSAWYAVLPDVVDDPARPSGGSVYDRRVLDGLAALGRKVEERPVAGDWRLPDYTDLERLRDVVDDLPDDAGVLVDGLIASKAAAVLPGASGRLRIVVLLHMPVGPDRGEELVLSSASAVVTTSEWSRDRVQEWYGLRHVHVVPPGTDPVGAQPRRTGSGGGTAFLCVGSVHAGKGHDLLLDALADLGDRAWTLTCVGSLDVDPDYVAGLQTQVYARSWERRVVFTGPLSGSALDAAYAAADLLVLPSRSESFGMVVVEALAHGLPVVAAAVGGVPEALGGAPAGGLPGWLVAPDDPRALSRVLRAWLDDPGLRDRLARSAAVRRATLRPWSATVEELADVLDAVDGRADAGSGPRTGAHR